MILAERWRLTFECDRYFFCWPDGRLRVDASPVDDRCTANVKRTQEITVVFWQNLYKGDMGSTRLRRVVRIGFKRQRAECSSILVPGCVTVMKT